MPNLHLIYLRVNEFQNKCYKVLLNKPKLLYDIIIILYIIFVSKKLFYLIACCLCIYILINHKLQDLLLGAISRFLRA